MCFTDCGYEVMDARYPAEISGIASVRLILLPPQREMPWQGVNPTRKSRQETQPAVLALAIL